MTVCIHVVGHVLSREHSSVIEMLVNTMTCARCEYRKEVQINIEMLVNTMTCARYEYRK